VRLNPQTKHIPDSWEKCAPKKSEPLYMALSDLVPCFYTGQDYRFERPAQVHIRAEVREFKRRSLGKFIENGKVFLFFKQAPKILHDGPLGIGNALPFSRRTDGSLFHYEIPQAGDAGPLRRHGLRRKNLVAAGHNSILIRRTIRVSARKIDFTAAAYLTPTRVLRNSTTSSSSLIQQPA